MPKTVLHYFPVKGLGESIRLLLAYGDVDFEDHRVVFSEWPAFKLTTPFGQIPVLEIEEKKYTQSAAIARYLGRKFGVGGNNNEEEFEIDQSIEFLNDIRARASIVHYEPDEAVKARKHETFMKDYYPCALDKLDEIIKENNGHLALGRLTCADFVFAGMYDYLKKMLQRPELETKYPSHKQVVDTVYHLPRVKAFCDNVPKSDFDF